MKLLSFTLFLLISLIGMGQDLQHGLIMPVGSNSKDHFHIPKAGLPVFDGPEGKHLGKITGYLSFTRDDDAIVRLYFIDKETESPDPFDLSLFTEVGYEMYAITYFDRKAEAVRVLNNDFNYWIKLEDLKATDFQALSWPGFLLRQQKWLLGYYAIDPGLNLRASAGTDSEVIQVLRGNLFEINLTTESDDLWYKVKVKQYKKHPCEGMDDPDNLIKEYTGWIKLTDEAGRPNVWYYSGGC